MYGDFLKNQEPENPKPPSEPEPVIAAPPSTVKKRGFGRSNGKVLPLRANAVPELSQVYSEVYSELAKKERRSHGTFFSHGESQEWVHHSNNTIPETLNSSREWNLPGKGYFSSQNDVRAISESTPLKSSQRDHGDRAPVSVDKENFYTPRKTSEAFPSTPAARCPLSALPVDSAPAKDTIDGASGLKSSELQPSTASTGFLGSARKASDNDIFRTPQFKAAPNQQNNSIHARQRLYGMSSSSSVLSKIPLHPAVAAGQQHAKQLQPQRLPEPTSQESRISRKLAEATPLTASALDTRQGQMSSVQEHQPSQSCSSWVLQSRPVETTPFKAAPNAMAAPPKQLAATPAALPAEKQSFASAAASEDSVSSTWVPHHRGAPAVTYSKTPHVPKADSDNQRQYQEILPVRSEPPSSKRKLEIFNIVEAVPEHRERDQQQKVPPVQDRGMTLHQSTPQVTNEPAKVDSGVSRAVPSLINDARYPIQPSTNSVELPTRRVEPPIAVQTPVAEVGVSRAVPSSVNDARYPLQPSVNSVELPTRRVEPPIAVQTPVAEVECPPPQAAKSTEIPAVKVTSPADSVKTVEAVSKPSPPGCGQIAVNGHVYSILSLLGRGGSSKVFQVLDPENSQLKAVKCVNLADTDPSICEGYLNEIKLLAELQDGESVIRMFDHEHKKDENLLLVVMEKGDTDLSKLIKGVNKTKKISAAMIVYYWTEMLNAVKFIHQRGTIHSDLKPANFLLVSGRLKLIDFGIASSVQEDMTSVVKESLTGTYNYISPEALSSSSTEGQGYKINYKSDVWSLGCILYSLVYGRTPFQHITGQFQKFQAIVNPNHKIEFPEPPVKDCPSTLLQAMKLCLVRNPKERASVDELLQLSYLEVQGGPERAILAQFASLAASVGLVHETEDNRYAVVVRAMQRLIIENERNLPFLGRKR